MRTIHPATATTPLMVNFWREPPTPGSVLGPEVVPVSPLTQRP